jgi:hypothetical protein
MVLNHTGFKEQQSLMDRSPYDEITPKQEPSSHGIPVVPSIRTSLGHL